MKFIDNMKKKNKKVKGFDNVKLTIIIIIFCIYILSKVLHLPPSPRGHKNPKNGPNLMTNLPNLP